MSRIRTIKPEFFRHEGLQDLEAENPGAYVMLVFAGLWGHCDKAGRFRWRPRTLKLDILPFLNFDMGKTLALLKESGFIRHYTVGSDQYGEIPSFQDHQRIGGKEAQEPEKYPAPTSEAPEKQLGSTGEALGIAGREGKGREREKEGNGDSAREARGDSPSTSEFSEFWSVYPTHVGKRAAFKAFARARQRAEHSEIIAGATRYAHDPTRKPEFTAHPATWLNADRWLDEPIKTGVEAIIERMNGENHDEYR